MYLPSHFSALSVICPLPFPTECETQDFQAINRNICFRMYHLSIISLISSYQSLATFSSIPPKRGQLDLNEQGCMYMRDPS